MPPSPGYDVTCDAQVSPAPQWIYARPSMRQKGRHCSKVVYNRSLGRARRWGVRKGERVAQGCRLAFDFGRKHRGTWAELQTWLCRWNQRNKPPLTASEIVDDLLPKARRSHEQGLAHAGHVENLRRDGEYRRRSVRNRLVAYLKGVSPRTPTVSELVTDLHLTAGPVRAELHALEQDGWLRLVPSGTGHRVTWTGAGTACRSPYDTMCGSIKDIKPSRTRRVRSRRHKRRTHRDTGGCRPGGKAPQRGMPHRSASPLQRQSREKEERNTLENRLPSEPPIT